MELIDNTTQRRAEIAIRFLPFNIIFYDDLRAEGLDSEFIYENREKYCLTYSKWFRSSDSVEKSFRWLIKLGILRREVDGQGLTSKVRLTPLGRQMIQMEPNLPSKPINILKKFFICLTFGFQL